MSPEAHPLRQDAPSPACVGQAIAEQPGCHTPRSSTPSSLLPLLRHRPHGLHSLPHPRHLLAPRGQLARRRRVTPPQQRPRAAATAQGGVELRRRKLQRHTSDDRQASAEATARRCGAATRRPWRRRPRAGIHARGVVGNVLRYSAEVSGSGSARCTCVPSRRAVRG
jgi:hypothetical protein